MDEVLLSALHNNFEWLRHDSNNSEILHRALLKELTLSLNSEIKPDKLAEILDSLGALDAHHTAWLSRLICDNSPLCRSNDREVPKRISYLRSPTSDRAFKIFSEQYPDLSASYGADFKSICEDVYSERADACILPLESSESGLLISFRTLALKYELSVYAACNIRQNDDSVLTLALMTSNFKGHGDRSEIYIPSATLGSLEQLSDLIVSLDCRLLRILTVSSEYSGEYDIHACIQTPIGLYNNVENPLRLSLEILYPSCISMGDYLLFNNGKE